MFTDLGWQSVTLIDTVVVSFAELKMNFYFSCKTSMSKGPARGYVWLE